MSRKLIVKTEARRDVIQQFAYLSDRSATAALRFREAVDNTFRDLARSPKGERLVSSHTELKDVRLWRLEGFENYLVVYRATNEAIRIIRVLHSAQDWMSILEQQFGE
jgi:plasmid stabilization system protein ParE